MGCLRLRPSVMEAGSPTRLDTYVDGRAINANCRQDCSTGYVVWRRDRRAARSALFPSRSTDQPRIDRVLHVLLVSELEIATQCVSIAADAAADLDLDVEIVFMRTIACKVCSEALSFLSMSAFQRSTDVHTRRPAVCGLYCSSVA